MCRKLCYLISFVLFLGLVVTSTAEAVGDPNLVGYWKLDESWGNIAADVSGHDYDAEYHWHSPLPGATEADGMTWQPTGGMVNGAAQFSDSNNPYIAVGDTDDANYHDDLTDPSWSEGTIALWLKLRDPQPTNRKDAGEKGDNLRFAFAGRGGQRRQIWFRHTATPGISELCVGLANNLQWKEDIVNLFYDWHYVVVTWKNNVSDPNGMGRVFVDGNDVKTSGPYIGDGDESPPFINGVVIGNSGTSSGVDEAFCGLLDDVALWNIAKTEAEVVAIYNTGITQPTFTRATEPNPGRGDFDVPICPNTWPDPNLGWNAGVGAVSHDVYFGTDYNDVNDGINDTSMGNQLGTDYDPGFLVLDETYYWRIDEQPGPVKGKVWEFTIDDGKATDPDPEDDDTPSGEDETAPDAILSWLPGAFADTHEIYLGTDEEEVNLADKLSDEYMGTNAVPCVDANRVCYDPCGLSMGVTYYWRIDEVNSVYGTAEGDIWGFKVYAYLTVDDFEPYTSTTNMLDTWKLAKNAYALVLMQTVEDGADDSNQYMEMLFLHDSEYGSAPWYSEAWRNVSVSGRDFTGGGFAKSLGVSYKSANIAYGGTTTDFGEMYIRLEDGSGGDTDTVTLTDPNMDEEWHEWNIDMADFDNPDLDLTDIRKIHLGVGDGVDHGWGYVYFDEIRKYALRCMPELIDLDGDINGDCIVDFEDIEDMGSDWLDADSNSIGLDGLLDPDAFLPPGGWVTDPCRGNCLAFDGHEETYDDSNDWVDIDDYLLPEFQNRTITTWVKNDSPDQEESYRVHIFSSTSYTIGLNIGATGTREGRLEGQVEDCKMTRIEPNSDLTVGEWHHVALVLGNKKADDYVYCELYLDGAWIADNENPGTGSSAVPDDEIPRHTGNRLPNANIGSNEDGDGRFIQATLDNFRIYDYNMPAEDVNELYELEKDNSTVSYKDPNLILWYKFDETSGYIAEDSGRDKDNHLYHPMNSSANIIEKASPKPPYDPDNKDIVNFVDYAALADDWLVEKMWPPQP